MTLAFGCGLAGCGSSPAPGASDGAGMASDASGTAGTSGGSGRDGAAASDSGAAGATAGNDGGVDAVAGADGASSDAARPDVGDGSTDLVDGRSPSEGGSIPAPVLSGTIGGKPWTFVAGETNPPRSSSLYIEADLWDQSNPSPCAHLNPGGANAPVIFLEVPIQTGTYQISAQGFPDESFGYPIGDYYVNTSAITGMLDIQEITATSIKGFVDITDGDLSTVTGNFEILVCAM